MKYYQIADICQNDLIAHGMPENTATALTEGQMMLLASWLSIFLKKSGVLDLAIDKLMESDYVQNI